MKLSSLSITDIEPHFFEEKYKVKIQPNSTVATIIYQHLTSNPGIIRNRKSTELLHDNGEYLNALHTMVSKGAPIQIFALGFNPKFKNPSVSNKQYYPDMSDLLSLIHLNRIAKGIREVYDYGFQFIIGYKGFLYRKMGQWSKETVQRTFDILHELNTYAEKIVGIKNAVKIVDVKKLADDLGDDFYFILKNEMNFLEEEYLSGNVEIVEKLDKWKSKYQTSLDTTDFSSKDELERHLFEQSIYFRAFENVKYKGGPKNAGILTSFPNTVRATLRGVKDKLSIQFHPHFHFHSHQRLTFLDKDGNWNLKKWDEIKDLSIQPIYFEEYDYPFYYKEV